MGWGRGSQGMGRGCGRVLLSKLCVDEFQEEGDKVVKAAFPGNREGRKA